MADKKIILGHKIGEKLKELRQQRGLTQKALAGKIKGKIDQSYIGKIERGEQLPSLKILIRISETLCVPLESFFQEDMGLIKTGLRPENLAHIEDFRQKRLIIKALQNIHQDDIPLLIEIINILDKHRKKRAITKPKAMAWRVGEHQQGYGLKTPSRDDLLFASQFIQKVLARGKETLPLEGEDLWKALQISLTQLQKELENNG